MTNTLFFVPNLNIDNTYLIDSIENIHYLISNVNNFMVSLSQIFVPFIDNYFIYIIPMVYSIYIIGQGFIIIN
jgi:hypothetical protein